MTVPIPTPNWCHPGECIAVTDGDTIKARLDLGGYPHRIETTVPVRIADLWAPERDEPGGTDATLTLTQLLAQGPLVVQTRKPNPRDLYGRVVADLWCGGVSVAAEMVRLGAGFPTKAALQTFLASVRPERTSP